MKGFWRTQCQYCNAWNDLDTHKNGMRCPACGRHSATTEVVARAMLFPPDAEGPSFMRRIVIRYALNPEDRDEHARLVIPMPRDAEIIYAANQGQYAVVLYVLLPDGEDTRMSDRVIYMVQTGEPFVGSNRCQSVGYAPLFDGADEWHIFVEPVDAPGRATMRPRLPS